MSSNPWSALATSAGSSLSFIIKICEYTYALRAVDQQTQEYLFTAQHAWENVLISRRLLTLRQDLLPGNERKDYERVIHEARKAAEEVARLLEPARVDVNTDGKIRFPTRVLWVLRDDANIAAALRRLNIVHTTLTQNISTLRLMRVYDMETGELPRAKEKPPSYESSQLLHWKRQTRLTPQRSIHQPEPEVRRVSSAATYPGASTTPMLRPSEHDLQAEVRRVPSTATYPGAGTTPMWLDLKPLPDLPTEFASELARRHVSCPEDSILTDSANDDDTSADDISAIREILLRDYGTDFASFNRSNVSLDPRSSNDSRVFNDAGVTNHRRLPSNAEVPHDPRVSNGSRAAIDPSASRESRETMDLEQFNDPRAVNRSRVSFGPTVPQPASKPGSWLEHQARRASRMRDSGSMPRYA